MATTHDEKVADVAIDDTVTDETPANPPEELKNLNYEMLLLGFSLLSVFNIFVLIFARDQQVKDIVAIIDAPLTVIFLFDFFLRLRTAESKTGYFFKQFGWADLLASIPVPGLKILRLFRVFRAARLIRHYGWKNLMRQISQNRADAALAVIAFAIICVLEFGAMAVMVTERSNPNANIKTPSDAIWWDFVTITTVGYGDRYPVTNAGRLVGMGVMMVGVGLFGVLTGYLANAFLSPSKKKKEEEEPQTTSEATPVSDTQAELAEIKRMLLEQEQAQKELRAMLSAFKATSK